MSPNKKTYTICTGLLLSFPIHFIQLPQCLSLRCPLFGRFGVRVSNLLKSAYLSPSPYCGRQARQPIKHRFKPATSHKKI